MNRQYLKLFDEANPEKTQIWPQLVHKSIEMTFMFVACLVFCHFSGLIHVM
ncbi:hypothetical protein [Aerosakkonema funiforme]|uniref:hypothetical protein n=1 Tax=Aerosakkonema funiforme TaxID=1246630 RepID=UPI0035B8041F